MDIRQVLQINYDLIGLIKKHFISINVIATIFSPPKPHALITLPLQSNLAWFILGLIGSLFSLALILRHLYKQNILSKVRNDFFTWKNFYKLSMLFFISWGIRYGLKQYDIVFLHSDILFSVSSALYITMSSFVARCFEYINVVSPIGLGKAIASYINDNIYLPFSRGCNRHIDILKTIFKTVKPVLASSWEFTKKLPNILKKVWSGENSNNSSGFMDNKMPMGGVCGGCITSEAEIKKYSVNKMDSQGEGGSEQTGTNQSDSNDPKAGMLAKYPNLRLFEITDRSVEGQLYYKRGRSYLLFPRNTYHDKPIALYGNDATQNRGSGTSFVFMDQLPARPMPDLKEFYVFSNKKYVNYNPATKTHLGKEIYVRENNEFKKTGFVVPGTIPFFIKHY